MSQLDALRSVMGYSISAPVFVLGADERSTRRSRPSTEERIQDRPGPAAARFFYLPHPDTLADTDEVRSAMRGMLKDPFVKAAWMSSALTVAAQDFQVHAGDDGDQLSRQQAEFVERGLEEQDDGMVGLCCGLMNQLGPDGYALGEKVWRPVVEGIDRGRVQLRAVKPKHPDRVRPAVDPFNNVVSVQQVGGEGTTYPISDFVYFRYFPLYDSPAGTAAWRAAYGHYWMHDTVAKLRIIHHEKKIGGLLVGTYTDDADKPGLEAALAKAKSATWLAVPEGVRVKAEQLSMASETEYKSFVEDCRVAIVTGISLASLQILQGATADARGDTKVQKSTSDLAPWYLTYLLTQAINRQLVPDMVDYNFPRVPGGRYPKVTFGAVSNQELLQLCDLLQRAQALGFKPSKKHYAKALSIQEADPTDPADVLAAPTQGGFGGGMGLPGMGLPGHGEGAGMGGDPFAQPPTSDPSGMDPMAQAGQPEGLFSERRRVWRPHA